MPFRTVCLVLSPKAEDSQVLIDGHDVTEMCRGVEVEAFVGEATQITLHLVGRVELMADIDGARLAFKRPEDTAPEQP